MTVPDLFPPSLARGYPLSDREQAELRSTAVRLYQTLAQGFHKWQTSPGFHRRYVTGGSVCECRVESRREEHDPERTTVPALPAARSAGILQQHQAAVDHDRLAGDVVGIIGGQKSGQSDDILGRRWPTQQGTRG